MTRNELKGFIKEMMINEMRIRRSDRYVEPERVRIARAVQSLKDKEAAKAQFAARDVEMLAKLDAQPKDVEYYMTRLRRIDANFKKQSKQIEEFENMINQVPDSDDPMESLTKRIELQKLKIRAEINRLETALVFQDFKAETEQFLKQSKV